MESLSQNQVFLFNPVGVPGEKAQMTESYSPTAIKEFYMNKVLPEWLEGTFSELKLSHMQISESVAYHDYRLLTSNLSKVPTAKTDENSSIKQKYVSAIEALQKAMVEVHLLSDLTSSLRNQQSRYSLKTSFGIHHEINTPSIPIAQYVSVSSALYNTAKKRILSGKVDLHSTLTRQRQYANDLHTLRQHWQIKLMDKSHKPVNKLYSMGKDVLAIDCAWRSTFTQSTENSSFTTIIPLIPHTETGHVLFTPEFELLHEKSLTLQLAFQTTTDTTPIISVHATSFDPEYQQCDNVVERSDLDRVLELFSSLRHQSKAVDLFQLLNKGLGHVFSYVSSIDTTGNDHDEASVLYPELLPCHVSETNIAWRVGSSLTLTADLVPVTHSLHSTSSNSLSSNFSRSFSGNLSEENAVKQEKLIILANTLKFLLQQLLLEEKERKTQETQLNPKMLTVGTAMQLAASTPIQSSAMKVTAGITQVIRSGWHQLIVKTQLVQIVSDLKAYHLLQSHNECVIDKKDDEFSLKLKFSSLSPIGTSPWSIHFRYHPTALCVVESKISALQSALVIVIRNVDELMKVVTEICLQRWLWLWARLLQQQNSSSNFKISQKADGGRKGVYALVIAKESVEVEVKLSAVILSTAEAAAAVVAVHCLYVNNAITTQEETLIQQVAEATSMHILDSSHQNYSVFATTGDNVINLGALNSSDQIVSVYLVQAQTK